MFNLLNRLKKRDKGTAAIEFALLAPVLILTAFGLIEIANYVFSHTKMNRVSQGVSNIITRGNLTKPQLDALLVAAKQISLPFDFDTFGCVLVSSINQSNSNTSLPPSVMWTDSYPSGSGNCGASRITTNLGNLPGGLVLNQNQTIITTEVFYKYQPLIPGYSYGTTPLIPNSLLDIYAYAIAVPRQGDMTTLPPN
jgi:Flp pilus assembly protein TadG